MSVRRTVVRVRFYLCISAQQETVFSGGRGQRSRPDGRWFIYLAETLLPPACPFIFPPRMTIHDVRAFLIPSVPLPFPCKKRNASHPSFLPYRRDSDREWPFVYRNRLDPPQP